MALRRLAQENNAISVTTSPRSSSHDAPSTPKSKPSVYRSPASTPSISSSVPFDWEAARSGKPPPYPTSVQNRGRKSVGAGSSTGSTTPARKAVIRKKSLYERAAAIPSRIAFEIALFPHNIPLPSPDTSAWIIAGTMHFLNFCIRISQLRQVRESDLGWEDMGQEVDDDTWFDWTFPVSVLLIAISVLNALYMFTRIKLYSLHRRGELVGSPHASFVPIELDFEPLQTPSLLLRIRARSWRLFVTSWRWLLGMKTLPASSTPTAKSSIVQQLQVWSPGELELGLFGLYSPAHSLLWMAWGTSNWILMTVLMVVISAQLRYMTRSFNGLIRDKAIIAAEVMNEYNQVFVNPRVNPIRRDAAVMTHEAEMIWE
ncbi:hypothetical protein AX16_003633 [Volvariella volvacea WC 439]|nr:hypothetical protein AX16_003633 [Volvariella volvacea WC 439]